MSTLAVVVAWDGDPARTETARRMLERLSDRAPDGISVVEAPGAALGIGKLVVSHRQGHAQQPLVDPATGITLVADVRIDNRTDLRTELNLEATVTDADIVLAAYLKWGPMCPDHLIGDFAFVVWDAGERRLFAARDPFGVRPLVYRRLPGRLLVASDVEEILAVDPSAWQIDDLAVVDYLQFQWKVPDQTFWLPIRTVLPGHCLMADERSVQVLRWWRPPVSPEIIEDHEECYREFERLFRQSVADRLDSHAPVLIQLSGGFDSSCIAVVAGLVGADVPLRAVGAIHPGLDCDESIYMDALKAVLPYPTEYWDGASPPALDNKNLNLDRPSYRASAPNGTRGDLDVASRDGARVILNGYGGDAWQSWPEGQLDHIRAGRAGQLWSEVFMRPNASWEYRFRSVNASVRFLAPEGLKQGIRRVVGRPRGSKPTWINDQWEDRSGSAGPASGGNWPLQASAMQRRQLEEIGGPRAVRAIENRQSTCSTSRVEARFPFLDVRCVNLLWRLPGSIWRPTGYPSRFHPIALRALLPPEIVSRRRKTVFSPALTERAHLAQMDLRSRLEAGARMYIARYCNKEYIGTLLTTDVHRLEWNEAGALCALQNVEAWLNLVYAEGAVDHVTREHMDTTQDKGLVGSNARDEAAVSHPQAITYEPPTVTLLGNVHELLAAGGSSQFDFDGDICTPASGTGNVPSC